MSSQTAARERIFVAWDTKLPVLRINLQVLRAGMASHGFDIVVPDDDAGCGSILNDIVIPGIRNADRVLILTDRPNANVGFEAGLAWGLGKPILFAYHGRRLPSWTRTPPFKNYIQRSWYGISDLKQMITNKDHWFTAENVAPPLPKDGICLDLCPKEGLGEALRQVRDQLELKDWIRPDDRSQIITLSKLNKLFGDTARLVWTIVDSGEDDRDGAINAANAIIAGWFYSRCLDIDDDVDNTPLWVLRLEGTRGIVDVELFGVEQFGNDTFGSGEKYKSLIVNKIEQYWHSRSLDSSSHDPLDDETASIAVLLFENLSDHEYGEGFSMGLTFEVIKALDSIDQLKTIPSTSVMTIGRGELSNEEAATKLKAKYIVRGSLTQRGNYCLIEVRLFRAGIQKPRRSYRRRHLWEDVLNNTVVEQIVKEIFNGINNQLSFDIRLPKHNSKAKELYWRGLDELESYNNTRNSKSADAARQLLQEAVIKDRSYEEARVQLAFLDIIRWETIGDRQLLKDSLDIWRDVRKIRENDPFALSEIGYISYVLGENKASAMDYVYQALEEAPDHVLANNVLALLYLYLGYYESSIKLEKEKVIVADPAYVYPLTNAALAFQILSDYDSALSMVQEALDIDPKASVAIIMKGAQYFYCKRFEDAYEVWQKGHDKSMAEMKPIFKVLLSWVLAVNRDKSTASNTLSTHRGSQWINGTYGPYYISLCALCGEVDEAINLLERAPTFAASYRYLISEPTLLPIADNDRFQNLLEKRYREWEANLRIFDERLPIRPPQLPKPSLFLKRNNI